MTGQLEIREAGEADLAAITAIYNDAVENTTAVWNEVLVDIDNRRTWVTDRQKKGFPVLVGVLEGRTVAYASYAEFRAFDGYRHTRELSVYVDKTLRGGGFGKAMLSALIEEARKRGVHVLIGAIEAGNAGSIALHQRLGFTHVGTFREVGHKFGRWLDLCCMQLILK